MNQGFKEGDRLVNEVDQWATFISYKMDDRYATVQLDSGDTQVWYVQPLVRLVK